MDLSRFAFKRERGEADPVAPKRLRREIAAPQRDAAPPADASLPGDVAHWLLELELIRTFRASRQATVDEFHAFLLSLSGQPHGRFWALKTEALGRRAWEMA